MILTGNDSEILLALTKVKEKNPQTRFYQKPDGSFVRAGKAAAQRGAGISISEAINLANDKLNKQRVRSFYARFSPKGCHVR